MIECTGTVEMWESAPSLVRRGGRVSFFAGLPAEARVSFLAARLHYDEVQLIAPFHFSPADVRVARDAIVAHQLPLSRLISDVYSLDDLAVAFRKLERAKGSRFR